MTGLDSIAFEEVSGVTRSKGCRLKSFSGSKKKDAVLELLKFLPMVGEKEGDKHPRTSLTILVPETMVSIVIGRGGNQIKHLQAKTQTDVFIDSNKTEKGETRAAQITGLSSFPPFFETFY